MAAPRPPFKELDRKNAEKPWFIRNMGFVRHMRTTPHYADTAEVLVCDNVTGTAIIGGETLDMGTRKALIIPPRVIHAMNYDQDLGAVLLLRFNLTVMKKYVDVEKIFSDSGTDLGAVPYETDDWEMITQIVNALSDPCAFLPDTVSAVTAFFCRLCTLALRNDRSDRVRSGSDNAIARLINWSEENFQHRITVSDAAKQLGYNSTYFCEKFRQATGMTYHAYLMRLRIGHACDLLRAGAGVNETAAACGFENSSHFVQYFKKDMGITPIQYRKRSVGGNENPN